MKKLHLCCASKKEGQFRPTLNYILVTKQECVATNANIMAIIPSKEIFTEQFIEDMPERFLIHRDDWAQLIKCKIDLEFINNSIKAFIGNRELTIKIHTEESIGKYPQYKDVIPLIKTQSSIRDVGVNAELLSTLQIALDCPAVKLTFHGNNKAIYVSAINYDGSYGIIMPFIL